MLPGYNRIFNSFAIDTIQWRVEVPDVALAIGFAEDLNPKLLPVKIQSNIADRPVWETINTTADASPKWMDEQVYQHEFTQTGWVGESYGGV